MLRKRVLEPIGESDFLNGSTGLRPGRSTRDGSALLDSYLHERSKFFWLREGDIRAAFESIPQGTLLTLLAERVADRRRLDRRDAFLKAGMMQGKLLRRTDIGTPQGAICSPFLAHVYMHQLDVYWWTHAGGRHRQIKARRRQAHLGNCALIRSADDWLLLTHGGKSEAYRLRDELQTFGAEELKLELAGEKTHITHAKDGCDFLGFHVQRYVSGHDRPQLLVTPRDKAVQRLQATVKEMTARRRFRDAPLLKFRALNAVRRGWLTYYRHSNAKAPAKDLDFWVNQRLFDWLQKRHKATAHRIITRYKHRQHGTRDHLGIQHGEDLLCRYRMRDQPLTKYRARNAQNPYRAGDGGTQMEQGEAPLPHGVGLGKAENNERGRERKAQAQAERGAQCERCGSRVNLDLHHLTATRYGGQDPSDNAALLCRPCHVQTPTFGDHSRLQGGKAKCEETRPLRLGRGMVKHARCEP